MDKPDKKFKSIGVIFGHGIIGVSPDNDIKLELIKKYKATDKDNILNSLLVNPSSFVGLEFEIENFNYDKLGSILSSDMDHFWSKIPDDSLRNGVEFVSRPMRGEMFLGAMLLMNNVFEAMKGENVKYTNGRTSVHVHVDVRSLSGPEVISFCLLYAMFERVLAKFLETDEISLKNSEVNRYFNHYCTPVCGSNLITKLVDKTNKLMSNKYRNTDVVNLCAGWPKYSALNIGPISTLGTLEFRMCHGTSNIPHVIKWVNFLQYLKLYAMKISPEDVIDTIKQIHTLSSYDYFVDQVFKKQAHLLSSIEDCGDLIMEDVAEIRYHLDQNSTNPEIPSQSSYQKALEIAGHIKSQKSMFNVSSTLTSSDQQPMYVITDEVEVDEDTPPEWDEEEEEF